MRGPANHPTEACAILFALGNVLNRKPLPMPPLVVVAWQVGLGCATMLILGVLFEQPHYTAITPLGLGCFIYMTLVPSARQGISGRHRRSSTDMLKMRLGNSAGTRDAGCHCTLACFYRPA